MSGGRKSFEVVLHRLMQQLILGEEVGELAQLLAVGQAAHNDEMGDFDECGLFRQFLDRDPAIAKNSLFAIDERDLALAGARVAVPIIERDLARLIAKGGDIDSEFFLRSFHNRQFGSPAVQYQFSRFIHKTTNSVALAD